MEAPEILAPDKCVACGTDFDTLVKDFGGFMVFPAFTLVPNNGTMGISMIYGIVFHVCPKCQAVMVNKNAVENQKKFNQDKLNQVLRPEPSRLIIPGVGKH